MLTKKKKSQGKKRYIYMYIYVRYIYITVDEILLYKHVLYTLDLHVVKKNTF